MPPSTNVATSITVSNFVISSPSSVGSGPAPPLSVPRALFESLWPHSLSSLFPHIPNDSIVDRNVNMSPIVTVLW